MSMLTSLAKAAAYEQRRAVRLGTARHVHLGARPLMFLPLALAGEANAPLACLVGDEPDFPRTLVVPQPRNRDLRFGFATQLAPTVLNYVHGFTAQLGPDGVHPDAPQVVVANPGGVEFTRLLGRSLRFRRPDGEWPVHPSVPELGRWLTWFAEQTEKPGSSSLLALTTVLSGHWATGQSSLEDANLAALMGWIAPWDGLTGPEAAAQAEDASIWPPAGPTTNPEFDRLVLADLISAYDKAEHVDAKERAVAAIEDALRSQLDPTWRLMWRAWDLLRALPEASSVERRWLRDRQDFTKSVEYWRGGGFPQAKVDSAVRAAQRLTRLERLLDEVTVDMALDDPLAMAEHRLAGDAFVGDVVSVDAGRITHTGKKRVLRPWIVVHTTDPVRLEQGATVRAGERPTQEATVVDVDADLYPVVAVTLELKGGMGNALTAKPGTVPAAGERLCYSALSRNVAAPAKFPTRDETPWTHGGPPPPYQGDDDGGYPSTEDDATEEWS